MVYKTDHIITEKEKKVLTYIKLHRNLSKKYKTKENKLTPGKIGFIRSKFFRNPNRTKKQFIKEIEDLMFAEDKKRKYELRWYIQLNSFLKSCDDEAWKDIVQVI